MIDGEPRDLELRTKLVIDTCVWLALGKDYRNLKLLNTIQELVEHGEIEILMPNLILEEFARHREKVLKQAAANQGDAFKRVRTLVHQLGDDQKDDVLKRILDVEHKLQVHGEAALDAMVVVEEIMQAAPVIVPSVVARSKAANRGIEKQAPFVTSKNSTSDAVILETYLEELENEEDDKVSFVFLTINTNDFSDKTTDERKPHPDLAAHFDGQRSIYAADPQDFFKSLLEEIDPHGEFDDMFFDEEPRLRSEILEAIELLYRQVWYNRHQNLRISIERGEHRVVPDDQARRLNVRETSETIWAQAQAAAKRTEEEVGIQNLGPWDDFEWGMVNGKLSALRWVLGDEWDMLDT